MSNTHKRVLGIIFLLLVLVFFGLYLRGIDYSKIQSLQINWSTLLLATVVSLSFRYWGVFIWRTILKDLGSKELPRFDVLSAVYAKAWMGRYIPGTVTWIAGKIYLASSVGISKSRLAVASILEAGVQIAAITTVSFFLIGFDPRLSAIPTGLKVVLIAAGFIVLGVLYPAVFNRILGFAHKVIRRKDPGEELRINKKIIARSFALYALGSFLSGTAYFFFTRSIEPATTWQLYFYLVGAYNLAGVIGMATPFVPSGLGVRDGVQLVLLSAVFPKEVALVLTIVSRLWSAVIDVLFYLLSQLLHRIRKSPL
jgi:glycosyltransferase 2 family protein